MSRRPAIEPPIMVELPKIAITSANSRRVEIIGREEGEEKWVQSTFRPAKSM